MELRVFLSKKSLVGLCAFLLLLLGVSQSSQGRAALVLETKGNNSLMLGTKEVRMRTLQVLPPGSTVSVPKDGRLRLSYFRSGRKEKVSGPCRFKITTTASQKLEGSGKIEIQARRNATTELKKDENLRRMGGELQASVTNDPSTTLAMLEPKRSLSYQVNTSIVRTSPDRPSPAEVMSQAAKPCEPFGFGPYFLTPEDVVELRWKGGPRPTKLRLRQGDKILAEVKAQEPVCAVDSELIKPSLEYIIELPGEGKQKKLVPFATLSQSELREYHRIAYRIRDEERNDRQSLLSQLIYLQLGMGLLNRAERTALQAIKEYSDDPGFYFTLARIQIKLNKKSEAKRNLYRAKRLESFKPTPE